MNTITPNFAARLAAARSASPPASPSRATPDGAARPVEDDDFSRHLKGQGVDEAPGRGDRRVSLQSAGESEPAEEAKPVRTSRKADAADPAPADGKTLPPDLPPVIPLAPVPVASGAPAGTPAGTQAAASAPAPAVGAGPPGVGFGTPDTIADEPAAAPAAASVPGVAAANVATDDGARVGAATGPSGADSRSAPATPGATLIPGTPSQPGAPGSETLLRPGSTVPRPVVAAATAAPVSAATTPAAAALPAAVSPASPPAPGPVTNASPADASANDRAGAIDGEEVAGPDGPGAPHADSDVAAPGPDKVADVVLKADGDRDLKVRAGTARATGHRGPGLADLAAPSLAVSIGSHSAMGSRPDLPSAPAVTVPLDSPDWGQKLAESVRWAVNQNLTHAQISLNPDHLGPLEIRLSLAGSEATVWFGTHSHAAADALAASAGHLRSLLGQSGFAQVNVDVSRQSGQQSAFAGSTYRAGRSGSPAAVEDEPLRAARPAPRSVLDAYA